MFYEIVLLAMLKLFVVFQETAIDVKSPVPKPWYRRSRKSIVRMIGSKVFWQTQDNGRRRRFKNRSVVRMLASRLPLKPTKRAYFEVC